MPEAPDLAVVRKVLEHRLLGQEIRSVGIRRPTVLRSYAAEDFPADIAGRAFESIRRRGKFLLIKLSGDRHLVINPMLTGALQYCTPKERMAKRVCLVFDLSSGMQLRYLDDTQMGRVYYGNEADVGAIPRLEEQGPDVLDEPMTLQEIKDGLRRFSGEIKGILTRGSLVSGIGNAYADEILWAARVSPFKRRKDLQPDDLERLHEALYRVPREALAVLEERMGNDTHLKIRDFLSVHGHTDKPCPRCGNPLRAITANQRLTNYCRRCQPGMLIRN